MTVRKKEEKKIGKNQCSELRRCRAAADHRLDHNEQAQQQGDDDARPPGGERPLEGDEGLDHTLDQHAEKGAWQEGHAAGHQRAADHGGGDGVHLHADGGGGDTRRA